MFRSSQSKKVLPRNIPRGSGGERVTYPYTLCFRCLNIVPLDIYNHVLGRSYFYLFSIIVILSYWICSLIF